ncbi:MAG: SUMF1/EgtB/PvdO family nonheme iron enzyme [Bacteroidales bacterium]|nr:SUMF1/EgtB/PvdO family nonheme iron enzyme [Bacteroidales bacterium]
MKKFWVIFLPGVILGFALLWGSGRVIEATSTDEYCSSCHVHPQADQSWKKSVHYDTRSGTHTHCVDCHLPPKGEGYLGEKIRTGLHDVYAHWFKDSADYNWDAKSKLENAVHHTYDASCNKCHNNLFPIQLSKKGSDAHLYYLAQTEKGIDINCINCHLDAGHYDPNYVHDANTGFGSISAKPAEVFTSAATVEKFENFTETIPESPVSFNMIAIPGGSFTIGSPTSELYRDDDEGPTKEITISKFFMSEIEVSWDEYMAFYAQTAGEGRSTDTEGVRKNSSNLDAIVGATPPYGQPDHGWGMGKHPVISISFHAAETYCRWLSKVTGKTYRLPTEAEWEYAARGGTKGPYFFDVNPKKVMKKGLFSSKGDTTTINTYVVYRENSSLKTQEPDFVQSNPFALKNMLGNVAEFCQDWYSDDAYNNLPDGALNPTGPLSGSEHVIRGGSYKSTADELRCANRDSTRTATWLRTDPQIPKSIWWFSDCFYVGFRVVCEYKTNSTTN